METMFVRLKPYDHHRGYVLRRFSYAGIKFQQERGWYKVESPVADYLKTVRQVGDDKHSPLAFDVCREEEAKKMDSREDEKTRVKKTATDNIEVSVGRKPEVESKDKAGKDTKKAKGKG